MTEADKILKMIESVDPADAGTLREIDSLVFAYVYGIEVNNGMYCVESEIHGNKIKGHVSVVKITLSLNSLPEWPDGLVVHEKVTVLPDKALCDASVNNGRVMLTPWNPKWCATEVLARLHTRIQAIQHERNNNDQ